MRGVPTCQTCDGPMQTVRLNGRTLLRCVWATGQPPEGSTWHCGRPFESGRTVESDAPAGNWWTNVLHDR